MNVREWLDAAQARADAASAGPWTGERYWEWDATAPVKDAGDHPVFTAESGYVEGEADVADAAFVAAARTDLPRAISALRSVLALHRPYGVYDFCGHQHEEEGEAGYVDVTDVDGIGLTCRDGFMYSICQECCTGVDDHQSEECVDQHPLPCWPCATVRDIADALGVTP